MCLGHQSVHTRPAREAMPSQALTSALDGVAADLWSPIPTLTSSFPPAAAMPMSSDPGRLAWLRATTSPSKLPAPGGPHVPRYNASHPGGRGQLEGKNSALDPKGASAR